MERAARFELLFHLRRRGLEEGSGRSAAPAFPGVGCAHKPESVRIGTRTDGNAVETLILELGTRLLPDAPKVRPVEVPPPPRLPPGLSDSERVEWLAQAYRAAFLARSGLASTFLKRSRASGHKLYPRLVLAALELEGAGVPPAAWVAASFDQWAHVVGRGTPKPAWVFSAKRWSKFGEWESLHSYCVPEWRTAPKAKALYADWRAMWVDLITTAPTTRPQVAATFERWFPGAAWEERLRAANIEAMYAQAQVDKLVSEGGWPVPPLWRNV